MELNLLALQPIVHHGPTPLFATVSGAHLYGFASPDSDIDLRGAFVLPLREVLRLREPEETITITQVHDGQETLHLSREKPWDLILLDLMIPAVDRIGLAEKSASRF